MEQSSSSEVNDRSNTRIHRPLWNSKELANSEALSNFS